jgi:hypothetical protein
LPVPGFAQEAGPTLILRPHCELEDQTQCPSFDVADPTTLITPPIAAGETLDIDVVLLNPTQEKIEKVRIWLSYDIEALEGTSLEISPTLPTIVPGQTDFSPLSGYAKIAASAVPGSEPSDAILPIARLVFTAKSGGSGIPVPLSFYDQRAGIEGHTFATTAGAPEQNLLASPLGSLLVQLIPSSAAESSSAEVSSAAASAGDFPDPYAQPTGMEQSASSAPIAPLPVPSSSSASSLVSLLPTFPGQPTGPDISATFSLIQVQNVRVGTKDNLLYVTWDSLSHPRLQGYNVYFGTLKGRYLNRRGVSVASRGAVIRDLPESTTYYVAVRAIDDRNQETAFSTEASVEIGNPSTSSAPITGSLDLVAEVAPGSKAPENPVKTIRETGGPKTEVPGKSGAPSGIVLLLLGSAAIGTLLACRRQTIARTLPL